ncbi:hypothetical protein OG894_41450 [Streptomyces sp. NBC_01724]|uniref:hypothetical protein n=1 Tax=unclassified Streptomyces TaxID=2593676 RepID=UPI002E262AB7|nr:MULTISPECIES: hypothetical protein [unclassified Streptomyces]
MGFHHADFVAYRRRLLSEGKPPLVATIAVGHRAHRLAFSLMKSGTPYDPIRWVRSVAEGDERRPSGDVGATGRPVMATPRRGPPATT